LEFDIAAVVVCWVFDTVLDRVVAVLLRRSAYWVWRYSLGMIVDPAVRAVRLVLAVLVAMPCRVVVFALVRVVAPLVLMEVAVMEFVVLRFHPTISL
jgi:hypothetical protein